MNYLCYKPIVSNVRVIEKELQIEYKNAKGNPLMDVFISPSQRYVATVYRDETFSEGLKCYVLIKRSNQIIYKYECPSYFINKCIEISFDPFDSYFIVSSFKDHRFEIIFLSNQKKQSFSLVEYDVVFSKKFVWSEYDSKSFFLLVKAFTQEEQINHLFYFVRDAPFQFGFVSTKQKSDISSENSQMFKVLFSPDNRSCFILSILLSIRKKQEIQIDEYILSQTPLSIQKISEPLFFEINWEFLPTNKAVENNQTGIFELSDNQLQFVHLTCLSNQKISITKTTIQIYEDLFFALFKRIRLLFIEQELDQDVNRSKSYQRLKKKLFDYKSTSGLFVSKKNQQLQIFFTIDTFRDALILRGPNKNKSSNYKLVCIKSHKHFSIDA